jgi:hypothetical protein
MKRIFVLILILISLAFAAACSSSSKNAGGGSTATTSMAGTWAVAGSLGSQQGAYQVTLVSSPCSVSTPVGTFAVQGPVCFIANNNSGQGAITGTGSTETGNGVLVGVSANPVPAAGTFSLVFVSADSHGNIAEFTGNGTVTNGTLTGTGACSSSTPICQGLSGTFSGKQ